MHPTRICNENCGMVFRTICNAHVDPSEKQALTNTFRAFCISGSCKQLNLQQEQIYQNKQGNYFSYFLSR